MSRVQTRHGQPAVYNASAPTLNDGDGAALNVDVNGNLLISLATALAAISEGVEADNLLSAPFRRSDAFQATITSANATSATQVKAKTASKRIYVTDIIISVDTAMSVQLQDDAGTPEVLMEQVYLPANSVFSKVLSTPMRLAVNVDLDVITSASGNISVTALGYVI